MSTRYINNREVSKWQAYENAIHAKGETAELWFDIIENWQYMPTKDEFVRFKEYHARSKKTKKQTRR